MKGRTKNCSSRGLWKTNRESIRKGDPQNSWTEQPRWHVMRSRCRNSLMCESGTERTGGMSEMWKEGKDGRKRWSSDWGYTWTENIMWITQAWMWLRGNCRRGGRVCSRFLDPSCHQEWEFLDQSWKGWRETNKTPCWSVHWYVEIRLTATTTWSID